MPPRQFIRKNFSASSTSRNTATAVAAVELSRTVSDLNGDGRSDIVITNRKGICGAWLIREDQSAKWVDLGELDPARQWVFAGCARLAGKDRSDIVLQSKRDNFIGAWTVENGRVTGWRDIAFFDKDVTLVGIGDFNGDGIDDLLLRNSHGAVWAYIVTTQTNVRLGTLDKGQFIAGIGDFNGDGVDDVLIRADGYVGCWLIDRGGNYSWSGFDALPAGCSILGVGDFNGSGTDDVLIENQGTIGAWTIKNGAIAGWMGLGTLPPHSAIEAVGDYDGDGFDDLLIRSANGVIGVLLIKGAERTEWREYGCLGPEWSTRAAAL